MKHLSLILAAFLLIGCQSNKEEAALPSAVVNKTPKNVILLIGDGMGLSQLSSAQFFGENTPNLEQFPVVGLIKTSSSAQLITDSAAGATAFACGKKSYNGAIGVDSDSTSVENITEVLGLKNMASGVVATSTITHATPASFYAHVPSRNMHEAIAKDMTTSNISYFAGGGLQYFDKREDGNNLLTVLENQGFAIDTTAIPENATDKMGILLAENAMPTIIEGRGDFLTAASVKGIECLSKAEGGFFLMIEGSQIDWGGHANDADYLISEMLDFDKTIGAVLDFAKSNGETLVIVTADHETGGLTLGPNESNYNDIAPVFSTGGHSATMIPVLAYGPGSESFTGIYENTEIYHKIMAALK